MSNVLSRLSRRRFTTGLVATAVTLSRCPLVSAQSIIAVIPVGTNPFGVACNAVTNHIYISQGDGEVSVIDGATNQVMTVISPHIGTLGGVAVNSQTNRIYVVGANLGNELAVIDGSTNTVVAIITVGLQPQYVAVNQVTNFIYAVNSQSNRMSIIDGSSNTFLRTIYAGKFPNTVSVDQLRNRIYTADQNANTVGLINGRINRLTRLIPVSPIPAAVAINPRTNKVYVANGGVLSVRGMPPCQSWTAERSRW